jgi:hypothetical protein
MTRFRFKIRSLIVLIVACGVALAALKESSDLWEKATFSLALLVLLLSVLLAIHRAGARRAFWLGFALCGSVYLGLSLIPPIEARLLSSQGLAYVHSKLPGQSSTNVVLTFTTGASGNSGQGSGTITLTPSVSQVVLGNSGTGRIFTVVNGNLFSNWGGSPENFVKIGHTLIALVLACLGGMLSKRLAKTEPPRDSSSPSVSVSLPETESLGQ